MPELTQEAWAQIRHDYENTDKPLAHICAEHEVSIPTVRYRMKKWAWRRRKPLVPSEGPAAAAIAPSADTFLHPPLEGEGRRFERERKPTGWGEAEALTSHPTPLAFANAAASDPPPPGEGEDPAAIVPRLQSAVARVLPAIEATIARLASGPQHPRDMEQAGRALSSLTRTLRELNGLLAEHNARPAGTCNCGYDMPEDLDEFRHALARKIEAFFAAETDPDSVVPGSALPPQK